MTDPNKGNVEKTVAAQAKKAAKKIRTHTRIKLRQKALKALKDKR